MTEPHSTTEKMVDEIASNCFAVRTRIASRDITRLYDDRLRPLGLRITQLSVLVAIMKMGDAMPSEIGDVLHLDRSTLSRTVQRLKDNGWIDELVGDDGRSRPVRLSRAGKDMIRKAHPLWVKAQTEAASTLKQVSST